MGRYVYHANCGAVVTLTMTVERAGCRHSGVTCAAADALALELAAELEVLHAEPFTDDATDSDTRAPDERARSSPTPTVEGGPPCADSN